MWTDHTCTNAVSELCILNSLERIMDSFAFSFCEASIFFSVLRYCAVELGPCACVKHNGANQSTIASAICKPFLPLESIHQHSMSA